MKLKLIIFALLALCFSTANAQNQIVKSAAINYTNTAPTFLPALKTGSEFAIDTATANVYQYNRVAGTWDLMSRGIDVVSGATPPSYTPGRTDSKFAINAANELYRWTSGITWACLNCTATIYTTSRLSGNGSSGTPLDIAQQGATSGQVLKWDGSSWAPGTDNNTGTTYTAGTGIAISGGNVISNTGDLSATNELQNLSLSGQALGISSGTGVTLPVVGVGAGTGISVASTGGNVTVTNTGDLSNTNELQTLSISGSDLSLSNGGGTVTLPTGGGITGSGAAGSATVWTGISTLGAVAVSPGNTLYKGASTWAESAKIRNDNSVVKIGSAASEAPPSTATFVSFGEFTPAKIVGAAISKMVGSASPSIEIGEFSDLLVNAESRYGITNPVPWAIPGLYQYINEGAGYGNATSGWDSITIDFTAKGEYPSTGITYASGYVYLIPYHVSYPTQVRVTTEDKDGIKYYNNTSVEFLNFSGSAAYRYVRIRIANPTYYIKKLTIAMKGPYSLTGIRYIPDRENIIAPLYLKTCPSYGGAHPKMYDLLSFIDANNAENARISNNADTYFAIQGGNVGVGTTTPSTKFTVKGVNAGTTPLFSLQNSTPSDLIKVLNNGKISLFSTNTASGTTGAQTINRPGGTVNFAPGATSLTVTNSLCTTTSTITIGIRTNDATMKSAVAVPGAGFFTIYPNAVPTAETSVGFFIFN